MNKRLPILPVFGGLLILLLGSAFLSLAVGQYGVLTPAAFLRLLASDSPDPGLWNPVLWNIRLPRLLLGFFAGISLGLAGMLVQALFRNPLAEPYLLGISAGAALGAVLASTFGSALAFLGNWLLSAGAFFGSLLSILIILNLAAFARPISTDRLLLAGIAISGLLQAIATLILLQGSPHRLREILFWLLGSLGNRGMEAIPAFAILSGAGILAAALLIRPLNLLAAGEEAARALGLSVSAMRWTIALLAALLAATTTAACGIIAFVGLLVPHIGRMLVGPDHRRLFPACLLIGPLLLLLSDLAARLLFPGQEIPISIVTGAIGCLVFLSILLPGRQSAIR